MKFASLALLASVLTAVSATVVPGASTPLFYLVASSTTSSANLLVSTVRPPFSSHTNDLHSRSSYQATSGPPPPLPLQPNSTSPEAPSSPSPPPPPPPQPSPPLHLTKFTITPYSDQIMNVLLSDNSRSSRGARRTSVPHLPALSCRAIRRIVSLERSWSLILWAVSMLALGML